MKSWLSRCPIGVLFWLSALLTPVFAHDPLQAWATATVTPEGIDIQLTLSSYPAQTLIDKDLKRPPMSADNFDLYQPELQKAALGLFAVTDGGTPLQAEAATVSLTEEADIAFDISYPVPHTGPLRFRITYLDRILEGFVTTLFVQDKAGQSLAWDELSADKDWLEAPFSPAKAVTPQASAAPTAKPAAPLPVAATPSLPPASAGRIFRSGVTSVMAGFTPLIFLCGLMIAARGFRPALAIAACFVLGYSLSLALAAIIGTLPSTRMIATLEALSLIFVGGENLVRTVPRGRWLTAFVFSLVYGLAFAAALRGLLPAPGRPALRALLAFNFGVDMAVLAVVAAFLAVRAGVLPGSPMKRSHLVAVSSLVVAAGVYWLLRRAMFP
ncbi:MAG TPA: HupE/UreJ family protein [Opitutaceae bacterium]|nr:HupE/UreJ family protein [Opitutaceae bacterium]